MSLHTSFAALLSAITISACGASGSSSDTQDANNTNVDASSIDASSIDASLADARLGPDAMPSAYSHTIAIDGTNDFSATDESFVTSSKGYTAYLAWDQTYLYVAVQGQDISSNDATRFVQLYLGTGSAGTTTGLSYNTQQPTLPFSADYHLRWKADNTFTGALSWDGSAWVDTLWDFTDDVVQSGDFLEFRIPRDDIGAPTELAVHISMINETNGNEFSFAAMPGNSFTDAYDPDFGNYYQFNLLGQTPPAGHTTLP